MYSFFSAYVLMEGCELPRSSCSTRRENVCRAGIFSSGGLQLYLAVCRSIWLSADLSGCLQIVSGCLQLYLAACRSIWLSADRNSRNIVTSSSASKSRGTNYVPRRSRLCPPYRIEVQTMSQDGLDCVHRIV